MIENAVKAGVNLIQGTIRKYVGLGNGNVSAMVLDVLRTAEGPGLRKPRRTAARNERNGLIVAEACKCGVLGRKIVIQADIELAFIDLSHRGVGKVEAKMRVARIGLGIKLKDLLTGRVDHVRRNLVAVDSGVLASIRIPRNRIPRRIALKRAERKKV